ncbi:hypothetical protein ONZ51_g6299 [Trametes cubensis]|uniref:F-box protein n=1 Tax=Trametes cubensis TaxID=1111947 RepID=A0AAD7TSG6_9APHY|nr:hypothetical protein ONZ51_g6299 [Trametes cubensis]
MILPNNTLASFLLSIGHCLRKLDVQYFTLQEDNAGIYIAVLYTIIDLFPNLRHFAFHQSEPTPQLWSYIQELIPDLLDSFSSLVSFDTMGMPLTDIELIALGRSEKLSSLTLQLSDVITWPSGTSLSALSRPFQGLRRLRVCGTMQEYGDLNKIIHLPAVCKASIQLCEPHFPLTMPFAVFVASLPQQLNPSTLTVLTINNILPPMAASHDEVEATTVRSDDLRPLLEFTRLESFTLHALGTISLDDAFLFEMAASWPALRMLTLVCLEYGPTSHKTTRRAGLTLPSLPGLVSLAFLCINLQEISLCLDATCWNSHTAFLQAVESGEVYGELRNKHSLCQLHTFSANNSSITSPESVTAFLSHIFPKLIRVCSYSSSGNNDEYEAWRAVDTYFATRARRQTEAWVRDYGSDSDSDAEY